MPFHSVARRLFAVSAVAAVAFTASCKHESADSGPSPQESAWPDDPQVLSQALPSLPPAGAGEKLFTKLDPTVTGVNFVNPIDEGHPLKRLYYSGFACGAVAMGDFDGDGKVDLFFTGGPVENALYLQRGANLAFEDVTAAAGVGGGDAWAAGVAVVDIDADGDLDIYTCNYDSPNQLFVNDGAARFEERAAEAGLDLVDACVQPVFADYDRDGDLDVFVLTNQLFRPGGRPAQPPIEKLADGRLRLKPEFEKYYAMTEVSPGNFQADDVGRPDFLMRNETGNSSGLPRFVPAAEAAGINHRGFGLSVQWWDFDDDGWLDLFVGNDYSDPDYLYRSRRDGTFQNVAPTALPHTSWFTMGSDFGDLDGDGRSDLLTADMAFTTHYKEKVGMGPMGDRRSLIERITPRQIMRNSVFLNTGTGRFREGGFLMGLAKTDWSWATKLADFDLDGRVDVFVANGAIRAFNHADHPFDASDLIGRTKWELSKSSPPAPERNRVFRNASELRFEESGAAWGLDHEGVSHGLACGDLDGDGDLDLVVTNMEEPASIFLNNSGSENSRVVIALRQPGANRAALGASIELQTSSGMQTGTVRTAGGYLTTSSADLVFGLGVHETVAELRIRWPDGSLELITDLPANHRHVIQRGAGTVLEEPAASPPAPLFAPPQALAALTHRERLFNDFMKQPLLPHKLSQQGPAFAWGDIDGDGDEDLFFGQGRGTAGQILRNEGNGNMNPVPCPDLAANFDREEVAAHFFDVDGDKDLDLYVVCGSYEYPAGAPQLGDRLYLNKGDGTFTAAPDGALPDFRDVGSCVVSADFDQDGDLDLFVGTRVIPGEYPAPPPSRLLLNESAKGKVRFTAAPAERAPGLGKAGLVTGAVWADIDADGWTDLLVAVEWGPVRVFSNKGGNLRETTKEAGLAARHGWWNGIAAADLDRDGDMDFAVANFGLNTKYHASREAPALLFYGDYHGDGQRHIVEAEIEDGVLVPIRGRSCSLAAMPGLAEKFKTYHLFASSSLDEIYGLTPIKSAERFACHTLESGLLINDGTGKFEFRPLPRIAQISPIFGMVFEDFDRDGHLDLALAGNFYQPQWETGPYDGSIGVLLRGDGSGQFVAVDPVESGLLLPGDLRGLAALDLNADGRIDLFATRNNDSVLVQLALPDRRK
ncbi:MAG: VCBS repeat-containing protein [Roseibacillus sp.]